MADPAATGDHRPAKGDSEDAKPRFPWLLASAFGVLFAGIVALCVWLWLTRPPTNVAPTDAAVSENAVAPVAGDPEIAIEDPAERFAQPGGIALPPAPDPRVTDEARIGLLPRIGDNDELPLSVYARPFNHDDPRPRIALLLTGLGLNEAATQQAIADLPGPVSLGFVAFADDLQERINAARAAGHEAVLNVPMEPLDFPRNDPGPNALLLEQSEQETMIALRYSLAQTAGYIGIAPFMGEAYMADADQLQPVMRELAERGLLFVDTRPGLISEAAATALLSNTPLVVSALRIDAAPNRAAIDAALQELEALAIERGSALGVFGPLPISYERVLAWAAGLGNRGLVLAPVSALYEGITKAESE